MQDRSAEGSLGAGPASAGPFCERAAHAYDERAEKPMTRRLLTGPAAAIAARAALVSLEVPEPDLGHLVRGTWAKMSLHDADRAEIVAEADGSLALKIENPRFIDLFEWRAAPHNQPVEATTSTGRLDAEYGGLRGVTLGTRYETTLEMDAWTWRSAVAPVAWMTRLDGAHFQHGNLMASIEGWPQRNRDVAASVGIKLGFTRHGQLLEGGGLRWYLWASKDRTPTGRHVVAVVEVLDGDLDTDRAGQSLRVVEFVLGGSARVTKLVGVDSDGAPVAAIALQHDPARTDRRIRCPVPDERGKPRWHGEFFRKIASVIDRADDVTYLATQPYVEALWHHLDGAYLGVQVALEAFAAAAGPDDLEERVRSKDEWLAWVDARAVEITAMGKDPTMGATLVNVLKSAWRSSSSRTVARYFEAKGIPLPRDVLKEVGRRNPVAHKLLMTPDDDRDVDRDLDRVSLIQTVLVAALALHVGYDGPIAGGQNGDEDRDWWPHRMREPPDANGFEVVLDPASVPISTSKVGGNER